VLVLYGFLKVNAVHLRRRSIPGKPRLTRRPSDRVSPPEPWSQAGGRRRGVGGRASRQGASECVRRQNRL